MLRRAFDAKFWGHITTIQAVLPHLAPAGSITLLGAVTARAGMPGTAGIAAINGAVEALVKPLAAELAPIRVNAVSPGFVDTPWSNGLPDDARQAYFNHVERALPMRRLGVEVAERKPKIILGALGEGMLGLAGAEADRVLAELPASQPRALVRGTGPPRWERDDLRQHPRRRRRPGCRRTAGPLRPVLLRRRRRLRPQLHPGRVRRCRAGNPGGAPVRRPGWRPCRRD